MKHIILYTDGACSGNPGEGGWGCILEYNGNTKEISGYDPCTTNNQMELTAVISGLKALKEPCDVDIYSDSAYVINAFNQKWINNWQNNNWRTADKKEVKNVELWKTLLQLCETHNIVWHKVKGHADNEKNNRCDFLATNEISKRKNEN